MDINSNNTVYPSAEIPGHEVVTDAEGRYTIDYLPEADRISIEAAKTGYKGERRPFAVTPGTVAHDIYLEQVQPSRTE